MPKKKDTSPRCWACCGRGVIEVIQPQVRGKITCPDCKGTGKVLKKEIKS